MTISFSPNITTFAHQCRSAVQNFVFARKHWIFVLFCAYGTADLLVLAVHPYLLSSQTKNRFLPAGRINPAGELAEYTPIWDFNVFHNGAIPPPLSSLSQEKPISSNKPVLSALPLTLNGTIVYKNPGYSTANIGFKSQGKSKSYQTHSQVETLARITKITSDRVYFVNLTNNKNEYIEVPDLPTLSLHFRKKGAGLRPREGGGRLNSFHTHIDRSFINQHLRSLPEVLQQAAVSPHWEHGKMVGYRFTHIQPGSPYEKLGFQISDVIKSVEGEQIQSELQAAELFYRLKNTSKLNMILQREGEDIPFSWTVNEDVSIEDTSGVQFK